MLHKFSFCDSISLLEWSPDSTLLLVGLLRKSQVEIKSIENPEWQCCIEEGLGGISYARWSPDSRKVITISEYNIRMSIWSLIDKSTVYINSPKFSNKGIAFSSTGYFMALAERKEGKDYIGVYFVGDWSLVSHFVVETFDLEDITWSKEDTSIVIWDNSLECKLLIYSPTGNLISSHEPYQYALGIQNCKWSPNGHYLAVGYNDNTVKLYNHMTWKLVCELNHISVLNENCINIFKEEEVLAKEKYSKYIEIAAPFKLPIAKNSFSFVNDIEWSYDSTFVATKLDVVPNVLWIWQLSTLALHTVIVQLKPIKDFQWSPKEHILLFGTDTSKLYSFTLNNVYIVDLVSDANSPFALLKINWNYDGRSFILSDKKQLIIGHPEINETQDMHNTQNFDGNEQEGNESNDNQNDSIRQK